MAARTTCLGALGLALSIAAAGAIGPAWGRTIQASEAVARFYEARNDALAWTGPTNAGAYGKLVQSIEALDVHGLNPADYHLEALRNGDASQGDAELDRIATDAYLTAAAHLLSGRLNPVTVEPDWTAARRERDLAAYLEGALGAGAIGASLEGLAPTQPGYAALKAALARYRGIAAEGGWPSIDAGPTLRLGDRGPRVAQLRRRLMATGDVEGRVSDPDVFDAALDEAVRRFQKRANLEPDGIAGAATLAELNTDVAHRIGQIRANMERWRWLPETLGRRHIRVNIADFRLEAWQDGEVERVHDVIVGRLYRKTPVFSGTMTYLVLNPWWETPPRLTVRDKLPAFRKDPASVQKLGFQVIDRSGRLVDPGSIDWMTVPETDFPYRIRQAPGPDNALGDVKFMFPNRHNVYLHDTPTRGLFAETRRDFSSGCVRVKDPLELAAWALDGLSEWPPQRVAEVTSGNRETRVTLATPIAVHILYMTAVAGDGGGVRFLDDIYDRDGRLLQRLAEKPS